MVEAVAGARVNVVVICGSLRKGSFNAALARTLPQLAPPGMGLANAPPFDGLPLYNHDLPVPRDVTAFGDAIRAADGVIFVSPEYNWTIPGAMKNALDWVTRCEPQPFKDKPVAIQSVSPSPGGGIRMQYHLRQSLVPLDAICFGRPEVFVALARTKFDETTLELKDKATVELVAQQLAAFEGFVRRFGKRE